MSFICRLDPEEMGKVPSASNGLRAGSATDLWIRPTGNCQGANQRRFRADDK